VICPLWLLADASWQGGQWTAAPELVALAIAGASGRSIMHRTGHRSVQMGRRYIRDANLCRENSAGNLGL